MDSAKISQLKVPSQVKQRSPWAFLFILLLILGITGLSGYWAWPKKQSERRIFVDGKTVNQTSAEKSSPSATATPSVAPQAPKAEITADDVVLTASGYIIPRRRIEVSPRLQGIVTWIGVEKGDKVTKGQVLVRLDDAEAVARVNESEARIRTAEANLQRMEAHHRRIKKLVDERVESEEAEEKARLDVSLAVASLREAVVSREVAVTQLSFMTIESPADGVVLEKLAEEGELVTPQNFGGTRGPSTALVSLADLADLQVELDLNEGDLSKVFLKQSCRVTPEAFTEKMYQGEVVEISPEANRQKGTLQIKVKIMNPDSFLIPELSARVDFIAKPVEPAPAQSTAESSAASTLE